MSRAIFLPAIGDPLLSRLWIRQYKKYAMDLGAKLYVYINSSLPQFVRDDIQKEFEAIGAVIVGNEDRMISHGNVLKKLFDASTEDIILLLEDDCFLFKREGLERNFRGIEQNDFDLAGSPRGSCAKEIWDRAAEVWNLDYTGYGDKGPCFWPNCLFVKRSDLLKTDLNFESRAFKEGEYIAPLDYTMKEQGFGDTLVWLSLQLRALNLRIHEIPQYHGNIDELHDLAEGTGLWGGKVYWTHTGSSSALQGLLMQSVVPDTSTWENKLEWERRFAWWLCAYDLCEPEITDSTVKTYAQARFNHVMEVTKQNGLLFSNMKQLVRGYKELLL